MAMNAPTATNRKPIAKVTNGGLASAAVIVIIAVAKRFFHADIDPDLAGALVALAFSGVAYVTRDPRVTA